MSSANDENFVSAQQRVLDGEGPVTTEIVSTFKDGSDHILQTIFFPVRTGESGKIEVGTVAFDITERKQTEKLLLRSQRKEAVGVLTRHIAHEFNNILSVVIGNLEFIDDLSGGNSQLAECVRDAAGEARRGAEIIDKLMAFASCQRFDAKDTELHQWWSELDDLVELSIGEKVTVDVQLATDLWHCRVDPTRLKHAVLDLFNNAGNAMPAGGDITFSAENVTLGSELASSMDLEPGRYVRLTVADNGPGISKEDLAHVFEPFYCGRSAGNGNGLGLSMVWGFAQQSGGCADISSTPDQGTSVYLYLPAADGSGARADNGAGESQRAKPSAGAKILLVEDKESLCQITRKQLERNGFAVVDVSSAEAALEALYDDAFDLLISDIRLPGPLNGDELADIALADFPAMKVVLMSAQPLAPAVEAKIGQEIEAFLPKPFDGKQAVSMFKSILE